MKILLKVAILPTIKQRNKDNLLYAFEPEQYTFSANSVWSNC